MLFLVGHAFTSRVVPQTCESDLDIFLISEDTCVQYGQQRVWDVAHHVANRSRYHHCMIHADHESMGRWTMQHKGWTLKVHVGNIMVAVSLSKCV